MAHRRGRFALLALLILAVVLPLTDRQLDADDNPATADLTQNCTARPDHTPDSVSQSGVPAAVPGEWVTFVQTVAFDEGEIYQDILQRPDGSQYYASRLELTGLPSGLDLDPASVEFRIAPGGSTDPYADGVVQPWIAGTEPDPADWVIETDTGVPDALFRLLFPGDVSTMIAGQPGFGQLSHTVPAGGEIFVLSIRAQVPVTGLDWGSVETGSECFASISTEDSNRDTNRIEASVSVVEPYIELTKTTPEANVYNPGNDVDYEFVVTVPETNPSAVTLLVGPARDVQLVDQVPPGLIPLDDQGDPVADGGTTEGGGVWNAATREVTYALGDLLPGAEVTIDEEMRVGDGLNPAETLTNTAEVGFSYLPAGEPDNTTIDAFATDDAEISIASLPPTVSKEASLERTGTDLPFTYTVTVDIPPNAAYRNFTILDILPDGLEFVSYDSATCQPAGPTCPAPIADLAPTVFPGGGTGIGWYPNVIPVDAAGRQIVLTYTAEIDPEYASGDPVEFFDEFVNDLTVNWNTVDRLGDAVEPSTASPPNYDGTVGDTDNVIYDRPILEIDKTVETTDGLTADERREQWDYALGAIATYTSEITNVGSRDATGLTLIDTPAGLDIDPDSITIDGNPCAAPDCTWNGVELTIAWPGPLAPAATMTLTYEAEPTTNGEIDNAISIPTYGDDLGSTYVENPADTVPLEIPDPVLTIEKDLAASVSDTGVANTQGTEVPFTFTVTNVSATTAYTVEITDVPPDNVCVIPDGLDGSAAGTVTETAPGVFLLDAPLAPGDSVTFDAVIEICGEIDPDEYENIAELRWTDLSDDTNQAGQLYFDDDPATFELVGPEFLVTKGPPVDGGATLNWSFDANENGTLEDPEEISSGAWSITIENTSPAPIGGLVIDDPMPHPFEYRPGTATILWIGQAPDTFTDNSVAGGGAVLAGRTTQVDLEIGQLLPGAEVRITVPFDHNGEDPSDGQLTRLNTVTVSNENLDFDAELHTADGEYSLIPVEVGPEINKTIAEVGTSPGVEIIEGAPGQQFDYTIDVTVPSHPTLWMYDLWAFDEMPDGLTLVNEPASGAVPSSGGWTVSCLSGPCPATEGGTYLGSQPGMDGDTELGWFLGDTPPDPAESVSVYRITFRAEVETEFDDGSEIIDGFNDPIVNTVRPVFNRDDAVPGGSGNAVAGSPAGVPDPGDYDRVYAKDPASIDLVTPRIDFEKTVYDTDGNPVTEVTAGEEFSYEIIATNVGSGPAFDIAIEDDLGAPEGIRSMAIDQSSLNVSPAGVTCNFVAAPPSADHLECSFAGPLAGDPDGAAGAGIGGQIVITYDATTVPADEFYSQFSSQNFDPMIVLNRAATTEYFEAPGMGGNSYSTGETISRLFAYTPVAEIDASCVGGSEILPNAPIGSDVQFYVLAGNGDRFDVGGNGDGDQTLTPFPTVDDDGDGFPDAGVGFNPEIRVTLQDKFTYIGTQGTGPGAGDPTYTNYTPFPEPDEIVDEERPNTYTLVWNTSLDDIPHSPDHMTEADFQAYYDLLIDVTKTEAGGGSIWFDLTFTDAAGNTDRGDAVGEYWEFRETDRHGCPGGPPPRVWKTPDVEDSERLAPGQAGEFVVYIQQPDDDPMGGHFVDTLPAGLAYAGDLPTADPNYAVATMDVVPPGWTSLEDYFTSSTLQPNGDTIVRWDPPPLPKGLANDPDDGGADNRWVIRVPVVALEDPPFPNEFVVNGFSWNTDERGARKDTGAILTEGAGAPSITKRVADDDMAYGDSFTYTIDVNIPAGFGGKDVIVYDQINRYSNWDASPYALQDLGNMQSNANIFPVTPTTSAGPSFSGELHYAHYSYTPAEMELDDYISDSCVVGCSGGTDDIDAVPLTPDEFSNGASTPFTSAERYYSNANGAAGWYLGDIDPDPEGQNRTVRLVYSVEAPTLQEQRQRVAEHWPSGVPGGATDPLFDDPTSYWFQELSQVRHANLVQIRSFGTDNANLGTWEGLGDDAWEDAPNNSWAGEISSSAVLASDDESVTVAYPLITMDKDCRAIGGNGSTSPGVTPVGTPNVECEITVENSSPVDAYDVTVDDTPLTDCVIAARVYYGPVRYVTNPASNRYWDPVADGIANGTGRVDPNDPDVRRYNCDQSGINVNHPNLTSTPNSLPASWALTLGPNQSESLTYQLRIDGWTDLPDDADRRDYFEGSWEVNGAWRNDAVLQPWSDAPGGTPLGGEIREADEVMFHDTFLHVSKFPFPEGRDLSVDAKPFINVFTDDDECSVTNLWPYFYLPCGYAARPGQVSYDPPQLRGDPYSGDYWNHDQPDLYSDLLQPPSRQITPFNWPWSLRGHPLGAHWYAYSGWRDYGDAYDTGTGARGWWLRGEMDDPDSWADVFDADPTVPYTWAIDMRIDGQERIENLDISDRLPFGWRYVPGSARIIDGDWDLHYDNITFTEDDGGTPAYTEVPLPDPTYSGFDDDTETACNQAAFHDGGRTLNWNFERDSAGDGTDAGSWPWDVRYVDARDRSADHPTYTNRDYPFRRTYDAGASDKANWIRIQYDAIPTEAVFECDPDLSSTEDFMMENNVEVNYRTDYDPATLRTDRYDMLAPVPNPLALTKTPDDDFVADDTVNAFTITFTNDLDEPVTDLVLTDTVGSTPVAPLPGGGYDCGSATAEGGTGFAEQSCVGGLSQNTTVEWYFAQIDPGETVTITMPIIVPKDETNLLVWSNSVETSVKEWFDSPLGEDGKITVVNPSAPPVPEKSADPNPATINDTVEYSVTWDAAAFEVFMDLAYLDEVPDGLTFLEYTDITCSGSCPAYDPDDVIELDPVVNPDGTTNIGWFFGDVGGTSGGSTWTMTYRALVDDTYETGADVADGDLITNEVIGYANEENLLDDPVGYPDPSDWTTYPPSAPGSEDLLIEEPELEISKAATPSAVPTDGSSVITYEVTVANNDAWPAYAVEVSDTPNGALENIVLSPPSFPGSVITRGWTSIDPTLGWFVSVLQPGESATFTYTAEVTDSYLSDGFGTADNEAVVETFRARPGLEPEEGDRSYEGDTVETQTPLSGPDLDMTKHAGNCVDEFAFAEPGQPLIWCIQVANNGGAPAYAATVTDTLPFDWTYDTGTTVGTNWATAEPTVGEVAPSVPELVWNIGDIAPGETAIIEFQATPGDNSPLNVTNQGVAESFGLDGSTIPVSVAGARSDDPATAALGQFALEISKTPDRQEFGLLAAGNTVEWIITVTNPSSDTSNTDLEVTDFLPAPLEYSSSTATDPRVSAGAPGALGAGPGGTQAIEWTITDLGPGESIEIAIVADVPAPPTDPAIVLETWYVNDVQVTSAEIADEVVNQAKVRFSEASVDIEKFTNGVQADLPNGPGLAPGSTVTWTYEVTNTGPVALVPAVVTDSVDGVVVSCPDHRGDTDADNTIDVLLPGDVVTCSATGTAEAGFYENVGTVTGNPALPDPAVCDCDQDDPTTWPDDPAAYDDLTDSNGDDIDDVDDTDASHYHGVAPSIDVEKFTNGVQADVPNGPGLEPGSEVTWTYEVTNTGNTILLASELVDSDGAVISCPALHGDPGGDAVIDLMLPGDTLTCSATGTAVEGPYANTVDVTGDPVLPDPATCGCDLDDPTTWPTDPDLTEDIVDADGDPIGDVTDDDPSHYFGAIPGIDVEKRTNGVQADTPNGPSLVPGSEVTWTYEVTNTGNTILLGSTLTDSDGAVITCPPLHGDPGGDAVIDVLLPGDTLTCSATGVAIAGAYSNTVAVTGDPVLPDPATCGCDLDDPATWPTDPIQTEDLLGDDGEPIGDVSDDDPSHYFGASPGIDVEKFTNGVQADVPNGPGLEPGSEVTWTYEVTNTGNTILLNAMLVDSDGAVITCPALHGDPGGDEVIDLLLPGETLRCSATGTAVEGPYANTVDVIGDPVLPDPDTCGCDVTDPTTWPTDPDLTEDAVDEFGASIPDVSDDDPSHYFGAVPGIDVEKRTNGVQADVPNGPGLVPGAEVTWTYEVTNTGNTILLASTLTDSDGAVITCPPLHGDPGGDAVIDVLLPGESLTCSATGSAEAGAYENIVDATGDPVLPDPATCGCDLDDPATWPTDPTLTEDLLGDDGEPIANVSDDDPSHYFGVVPGVEVEKRTNGVQADIPNGPGLEPGSQVTWTYEVTNTGNTILLDTLLTDSDGAVITCPPLHGDPGGDEVIDLLLPGETLTCSATGEAVEGPYENTVAVTGDPVLPDPATCGCDVTDPTTWPTDPEQTEDIVDPDGDPIPDVSDDDPSHYFGATPGIDVEKRTNGVQADVPNGPGLVPGAEVTWTYEVTNTGNTILLDTLLTDSDGAAITCPPLHGDPGGDPVIDVLLPGESLTCSATGSAEAGAYSNIVDITGDPALPDPATCGCDLDDPATWPTDPTLTEDLLGDDGEPIADVSDDDPSHYFGVVPGVDVEKRTNGVQADVPNGPGLEPGSEVTWTYEVTNTGNTILLDTTLTDSDGAVITCPPLHGDPGGDPVIDLLLPGETLTCSATGEAVEGPYENTVAVTGDPVLPDPATCGCDVTDPTTWPTDPEQTEDIVDPDGDPILDVSDDDPSHYFGATPGIDVEKRTNGFQADTPTGPGVLPGDTVTWTYEVTNSGNTILLGAALTDSDGAVITCPPLHGDPGGDPVIDLLLPGETITCSATGVAEPGQYQNTVDATADPVLPDPATCGCDLYDPTTWPTDPTLTEDVVDENGEPLPDVADDDPSHYFGSGPAIDVEKATNGFQADITPGPGFSVGDTVTWTYEVTNTGDVPLADVEVTDSRGETVVCEPFGPDTGGDHIIDLLFPGESVSCSATGVAVEGQYRNDATVEGQPVLPDPEVCECDPNDPTTWPPDPEVYIPIIDDDTGEPLAPPTDSDPSHYFGTDGELEVEKATNGFDADEPNGPGIVPGSPITWSYEVTNGTDVALVDVTLVDDQGVEISCPDHRADTNGNHVLALLLPGDVVTCTGEGIAGEGPYRNEVSVTGNPVLPAPEVCDCDPNDPTTWPSDPELFDPVIDPETGEPVGPFTDDDPSNHFGSEPGLSLEKSTNGFDADVAPGPSIAAGQTAVFVYDIVNTGNTALSGVVVTDDQGVAITCPDHRGDTDGDNVIDFMLPGDALSCTGSTTAEVGAYVNLGEVTGDPVLPDPEVCDCDPGDPSSWPEDPDLFVEIIDDVTGEPVEDPTASDPSNHFGAEGGLEIEKATNGDDADDAPGPGIAPGDPVTWTYEVTNASAFALADVTLVDDQGVEISCPDHRGDTDADHVLDLLLPGDAVTCTGTGVAEAGPYLNQVTSTGQPVLPDPEVCGCDVGDPTTWPDDPESYDPAIDPETGDPVGPLSAGDPSNHYGAAPGSTLEKRTNGADADDAGTGPTLTEGDAVTWTYEVTNTGNTALLDVTVSDDDPSITIECGSGAVISVLLPGEAVSCTGTGVAGSVAYTNMGSIDSVVALPDPETCGCDLADPSSWPDDPSLYVRLIDSSTGAPLVNETASDASHYSGQPVPVMLPFTDTPAPTLPVVPLPFTGSAYVRALVTYGLVAIVLGGGILGLRRRRERS